MAERFCTASVVISSIAFTISEFMTNRTEFIGTPTEFANEIDPDGTVGITPKKAARQISECIAALSKIGITARVYRSNGKRLIELKRAESVDFSGVGEIVPIDPVAPCLPL